MTQKDFISNLAVELAIVHNSYVLCTVWEGHARIDLTVCVLFAFSVEKKLGIIVYHGIRIHLPCIKRLAVKNWTFPKQTADETNL